MISLEGARIAAEAHAEVVRRGEGGGPARVVIDSRDVRRGDLFLGLQGEHRDGGEFASGALAAGAWGVLVGREWGGRVEGEGWVLSADDPLASLQDMARGWLRELDARVLGITGSTGKTSVKDIARTLVPAAVHASPENYNTEIGLPLAVLGAPPGTDLVVLEMGMRGPGQIAELCAIAAPDVAVITNVGPVHIELLGSIEAIAAAKAEILEGIREGGTAVVPADSGPLEPHLERSQNRLSFGAGGDVEAAQAKVLDGRTETLVRTPEGEQRFEFPFTEAHNVTNALAAIAAGLALGFPPAEMASRAPGIVFSRLRGELVQLPEGATLINDSYNANPISMRAALDHLATIQADGRRVAVLGEMRELGPDAVAYHREIGEYARERGVEVLIGVGELAVAYAPDAHVSDSAAATDAARAAIGPGDVVLVKGSRAVGLERVAEALSER